MKVRRYKGKRAAERGIDRMMRKCYVVQNLSTKPAFRVLTGVFTRRQIYTVTFVKAAPD